MDVIVPHAQAEAPVGSGAVPAHVAVTVEIHAAHAKLGVSGILVVVHDHSVVHDACASPLAELARDMGAHSRHADFVRRLDRHASRVARRARRPRHVAYGPQVLQEVLRVELLLPHASFSGHVVCGESMPDADGGDLPARASEALALAGDGLVPAACAVDTPCLADGLALVLTDRARRDGTHGARFRQRELALLAHRAAVRCRGGELSERALPAHVAPRDEIARGASIVDARGLSGAELELSVRAVLARPCVLSRLVLAGRARHALTGVEARSALVLHNVVELADGARDSGARRLGFDVRVLAARAYHARDAVRFRVLPNRARLAVLGQEGGVPRVPDLVPAGRAVEVVAVGRASVRLGVVERVGTGGAVVAREAMLDLLVLPRRARGAAGVRREETLLASVVQTERGAFDSSKLTALAGKLVVARLRLADRALDAAVRVLISSLVRLVGTGFAHAFDTLVVGEGQGERARAAGGAGVGGGAPRVLPTRAVLAPKSIGVDKLSGGAGIARGGCHADDLAFVRGVGSARAGLAFQQPVSERVLADGTDFATVAVRVRHLCILVPAISAHAAVALVGAL